MASQKHISNYWTITRNVKTDHQMMKNEKIRVAVSSIIASASLVIIKLVIGFSTNSLGILSEALHSGLDVIAAVMTFYAVRIALRPKDVTHTYGYAKYESLTSLTEIILLFAVAGWVFYEAIQRLLEPVKPEITIFSFGVMIASIVIDFGRSRALYRVARKYGSQALEADALHFKADMITSAIVLAGLSAVFFFNIPNADTYAAIVIAVLIVYTTLGLGRRTMDVLLDKAPKGISAQITELTSGLEGITRVYNVRVRQVGQETFVDLRIEVPRTYTHEKAHAVATMVEEKIRGVIPQSDVMVHVDAIQGTNETIMDVVRLVAAETGGIRNVHSTYLSANTPQSDDLHLYLDVQMDGNLDFKEAHQIVDGFEEQIKQKIPKIKNITTHIETETDQDSPTGIKKPVDESFLEKIRKLALSVENVKGCQDIEMISTGNELHVTLKIQISAESKKMSLDDAHRIATIVQNLIISELGISRAIVHAEPI